MKNLKKYIVLPLLVIFFFSLSTVYADDFGYINIQDLSSVGDVPEPVGVAPAPSDVEISDIGAETKVLSINTEITKLGTFIYENMKNWRSMTAASLLPQFIDANNRNQCDVGCCHAFGGIAILEAAYFRAHGISIQLSEADIFVRKTVLTQKWYNDFCSGNSCKLNEGNNVFGDLKYAQKNGVATSVGYSKFLERYRKYRKAEEFTLEGIAREEEEMGFLVRLFYNPRKHWAKLQSQEMHARTTRMFLIGRDKKIDAERANIKRKIKDFRIKNNRFTYVGASANKRTKVANKKKGIAQEKLIISELSAGRPVAVSMSLSGLSAWGQYDGKEHANHAFLLIGFKKVNGETVFQTRNSWGGKNPDIKEDELCRIYGIITIKVKGE